VFAVISVVSAPDLLAAASSASYLILSRSVMHNLLYNFLHQVFFDFQD
jgi:hypothetical protein